MVHAKRRSVGERNFFIFIILKEVRRVKYILFFKIHKYRSWHFESPLMGKMDYISSGKRAANGFLLKFH